MTDRLKGFLVVLDDDMREDDAQPILDAIRQLRHVLSVTPMVAEHGDYSARVRVLHEIRAKILDVVALDGFTRTGKGPR